MICIFCRNPCVGSPPEHFIPEHIGGRETIDCICKTCNHGFLAKIDGRIRNNIQLSMAIDSTSRPRYAELIHGSGSINRKVRITDGTKNKLKYSASGPDGAIHPATIKLTIKPDEDLLLLKVFAKILFECISFKFGYKEALSAKYDVFRTYLQSESESIPEDLSIKLVAVHITGNEVNEFVSFDMPSSTVISNMYVIPTKDDLSGANIVLAYNVEGYCDALVVLLGGKKSGRIRFGANLPNRLVYFTKKSN